MVQGLDPSSEQFLVNLDAISRRMERAQRALSSGKRLVNASDDPDQVGLLLQARAELDRAGRLGQDLGRIKSEVDAAEQALQQAVSLVERAEVIGAQGSNGTQTAETRATLAGEVKSILEQLVGLSQTTIEGRYVFSGDSDQTPPYTLDWSLDPPLSFYQGAPATRKAIHPSGVQFPVSRSADAIFDDPDSSKNVFAAVNNLRLALSANDEPGILSAVNQLDSAGEFLNSGLGFYGSVQNQVADAIDSASRAELRLKTRVSEIQDADLAESILELNQARYQQEAALGARAQMPRTSLFDYLG